MKINGKIKIDKRVNRYYSIISRIDIFKFTYDDYTKETTDNKFYILREDPEKYIINNEKQINNSHDKTYRKILSNKKDATYVINKALKLENKDMIKPEELEKYNTSFITNQLENREADLVYKLKNSNIYFLIEHQNKIDYSMPYRVKEYSLEIIKSAIDIEKIKTKQYQMPKVIPIILYTGRKKWDVKTYLDEIEDERFKKIDLLKYNLIDINDYTEEKLINSKNFLDKVFLIEKAKETEEIVKMLEKIITKITDVEDKKGLWR